MKNIINNKIAYLFALFMPLAVQAQISTFGGCAGGGGTASGVLCTIIDIVDIFIILMFFLATAVFLWGIVMYLAAAGDESKIETGRKYMIWGVIALFVMVAAWGIVQILVATFSIQGPGGIPAAPL